MPLVESHAEHLRRRTIWPFGSAVRADQIAQSWCAPPIRTALATGCEPHTGHRPICAAAQSPDRRSGPPSSPSRAAAPRRRTAPRRHRVRHSRRPADRRRHRLAGGLSPGLKPLQDSVARAGSAARAEPRGPVASGPGAEAGSRRWPSTDSGGRPCSRQCASVVSSGNRQRWRRAQGLGLSETTVWRQSPGRPAWRGRWKRLEALCALGGKTSAETARKAGILGTWPAVEPSLMICVGTATSASAPHSGALPLVTCRCHAR